MDIKREIEREHSRRMALKVVRYIGNDPKRLAELMNVFTSGPYRTTQRAAWPLSICGEQEPKLMAAHLGTLISFLKKERIHPAVKRNILRVFQFVPIPKRMHGTIADICFQSLQKADEPIAIKVFAMSVLVPIILHHPELKNELQIILEDQLPYGSPGFGSRARKVLKQIAKAEEL